MLLKFLASNPYWKVNRNRMTTETGTLFEAFLNQHDEEAWNDVIKTLLPSIHEVDRTATRIWFYFFPLALARAFSEAEDTRELDGELLMAGEYRLKDQIDTSHRFLYGHRYWPEVKTAVTDHASSSTAPASLELPAQILQVARSVADRLKTDKSLLTGITAVAFMTLEQVGLSDFKASGARITAPRRRERRTPEQMLAARARDDGQGLLGFLRGPRKLYTVTFDESDDQAKFKLISSQHITTAAAEDKRDYVSRDARCTPREGPIPVQCRSASCGTCWVGVVGGADKLSEVGAMESRRIKEFGYIETDEPKPIIRLACQAQAYGAVSIVIPPWNGVFGKFLRARKEEKAEAQKGSGL
jgi:ferredoxin